MIKEECYHMEGYKYTNMKYVSTLVKNKVNKPPNGRH